MKMEQNEQVLAEAQERIDNIEVTSFLECVASDVNYGWKIYRETHTDVLYLYEHRNGGYGHGVGMTVMLGPDGTPLTYTAWKQMEEHNGENYD